MKQTSVAASSVQRAVRDVTLIVLSILIAFGLEGWRERRAEQRLLGQHLVALANEFGENQAKMEVELAGMARSAAGSRTLLDMMGPMGQSDPESAQAAVFESFNAGLFTAQHPVLTSMLASGELVDLQNAELMSRLAGWQDRMGHMSTDSEHLERNREETVADRFVLLGQSFGIFAAGGPEWTTRVEGPELAKLLSDPGLGVGFQIRYGRAVRLGNSYRDALEEGSLILGLLEAEISRLGAG